MQVNPIRQCMKFAEFFTSETISQIAINSLSFINPDFDMRAISKYNTLS